MNPTRDLAVYFRGFVEGSPDMIQGAAILLGVSLPFLALFIVAGLVAWLIDDGERP